MTAESRFFEGVIRFLLNPIDFKADSGPWGCPDFCVSPLLLDLDFSMGLSGFC